MAVPTAAPYTLPVEDTVATEAALLVQVPPVVVFVSVVVVPVQITVEPVLTATTGVAITVSSLLTELLPQLLVKVYTSVTVSAVRPVSAPVEAFMVATEGFRLLQVPPLTALVSVVEPVTHTNVLPPMAEGVVGKGLTVTSVEVTAVPHALET